MAIRLQTTDPRERQTSWPFTTPSVQRPDAARKGAVEATSQAATAAVSGARVADFQQQLRKQLSDPATRSALRAQQRSAVLQLYGELVRSWHLAADKSDRFLDLLAEQQLRAMDRSLAPGDAASVGAAGQSGVAAHDAQSDGKSDELNALLTDPQREQLSRQQATMRERLTVSSLSDELALAQMPMTDSQQQQLIQIMYDERTAIPAPDVENSFANSDDARGALVDWESALEQRVQDRAATVLTSAQQARYEQFMSRQRAARGAFATFEVAQSSENVGAAAIPGTPTP